MYRLATLWRSNVDFEFAFMFEVYTTMLFEYIRTALECSQHDVLHTLHAWGRRPARHHEGRKRWWTLNPLKCKEVASNDTMEIENQVCPTTFHHRSINNAIPYTSLHPKSLGHNDLRPGCIDVTASQSCADTLGIDPLCVIVGTTSRLVPAPTTCMLVLFLYVLL